MELLWQDGAVVAHSQAQAHHHHHRHPLVQVGAGNTGASGVTGEAPPLPWLPCSGGALGGDVYSQLWQSIAQADGRVVCGDAAAVARPPAKSGNSGAGSSRTAGEVGSSFCGSNLVAAALHLDDDIDDVGVAAALPMPLDDPAATATGGAAGAGGSTSSGWNSNALTKRSRDEFDEVVFLVLCCSCQWVQFRLLKFPLQFVREKETHLQDADLDTVDETPPSSRDRRPASNKRRTRAAEVHNMSERVSLETSSSWSRHLHLYTMVVFLILLMYAAEEKGPDQREDASSAGTRASLQQGEETDSSTVTCSCAI